MSVLFSAFPGTGKSTLCKTAENHGLIRCHVTKDETGSIIVDIPSVESPDTSVYLYDSDSSNFPKDGFPGNYIEHIKETLGRHKHVIMLLSSHEEVRSALRDNDLNYQLVYPGLDLKEEYLERYRERGSPEGFINLMESRWEEFVESCGDKDPSPELRKHQLSAGQGLIDVAQPFIDTELASVEKPTPATPATLPSKLELKELFAAATADLIAITENKDKLVQEQIDGQEAAGDTFDVIAAYARDQYGVEITPDIAGVESFMDQLKTVLKKAGEFLKGQPDKRDLVQIKKYISEAQKAIKVYSSSSWLDKQVFKTEMISVPSMPGALKVITKLDDVDQIVSPVMSQIEKDFNVQKKFSVQQLPAGLKVFRKYENKSLTEATQAEAVKDIEAMFKERPAGPDLVKLVAPLMGDRVEGRTHLHPLDKAGVKKAVGFIETYSGFCYRLEMEELEVAESGVSFDDLWDSIFWSDIHDEELNAVRKLLKTIEWENITDSMGAINGSYEKAILPILQFLENWILYSVE
ncbi:hypothetical protein D6_0137 [Aeromonas phage D6]|uniref:Uncharacterized protein n=1 Tax=Aeromonas phage D6 TaxID=2593322 RepID=A0A514TW86_9CAUD|nr:hypothetical protein PQC08_gp138 [Aeromonas phage D6]QDJ97297.1 hypothetical protein D6_0137 [Aeromonas phage D6]